MRTSRPLATFLLMGVLIAVVSVLGCIPCVSAAADDSALTVDDLRKLHGEVDEAQLVRLIQLRCVDFTITPDSVIQLSEEFGSAIAAAVISCQSSEGSRRAQGRPASAQELQGIMIAIAENETARFDAFVDLGLNLNGCTPMNVGEFAPIHSAVAASSNTIYYVKRLLDAGVDPNLVCDSKETALGLAVVTGRIAVIEALLDAGADIDRAEGDGLAPLAMATLKVDVARLLLERGADPNIRRRIDGMTPLMFACDTGEHPEVVSLLLDHGADPNLRSKRSVQGRRNMRALDFAELSRGARAAEIQRIIKEALEAP